LSGHRFADCPKRPKVERFHAGTELHGTVPLANNVNSDTILEYVVPAPVRGTDGSSLSPALPDPVKVSGSKRDRVKPRVHTLRPKGKVNDWRLLDSIFDPLHEQFHFTLAGCCDSEGKNGHAELPFCSPLNDILKFDITGHTVFINPPWDLVDQILRHLNECRKKDVVNTRAVLVLPWDKFKHLTKGMKLLKEYPAGTPLFTSSPPDDGSLRREVTPAGWSVHCWLIDKDAPLPTDNVVSVGVEGLYTAPNPAVKRQKVGCSEFVRTDSSPQFGDVGLDGSSDPPIDSGNFEAPWLAVGLDFVTQLPLCDGKDSVMVVVDHFPGWLISCHAPRKSQLKSLRISS